MKVVRRSAVDVELTNRCNALCSFCPRDVTPEQGFMTFDTFKQVIARVKESDSVSAITMTGQGESTLHPQLVEFVRYASGEGVKVSMTTNANLLEKDFARQLLKEGLTGVTFSVSDFGDDYELVYNLSWEKTRTNILNFLELKDEMRDKPIEIILSIVEHDLNVDKIDDMKAFWREKGINAVLETTQNNRGGACDNGHYFLGNDRFDTEARDILVKAGASSICSAPFFFIFVGWNGQYYVCCGDYKKESALGSVFDYSFEAMDQVKLDALVAHSLPACINCNVDPINAVRELMFEIEQGDKTEADIETAVRHYVDWNNPRLPADIDIMAVERGHLELET